MGDAGGDIGHGAGFDDGFYGLASVGDAGANDLDWRGERGGNINPVVCLDWFWRGDIFCHGLCARGDANRNDRVFSAKEIHGQARKGLTIGACPFKRQKTNNLLIPLM